MKGVVRGEGKERKNVLGKRVCVRESFECVKQKKIIVWFNFLVCGEGMGGAQRCEKFPYIHKEYPNPPVDSDAADICQLKFCKAWLLIHLSADPFVYQ